MTALAARSGLNAIAQCVLLAQSVQIASVISIGAIERPTSREGNAPRTGALAQLVLPSR